MTPRATVRDAARALFARSEMQAATVASAVSLAVYVPRVAPALSLQGDSAVFVTAGATWGIAQPSGYPLWTALAHVWSKLPLGTIPHRLHLLSAVLHVSTVFVVAWAIVLLTGSRVAAVGGALALAFSRAFFLGSLYTEVFPLNDLFTALALLAGITLYEARGREDELEHALVRLAVVTGLASAHHQTIALLAPALVWLVWKSGAWPLLARPPGKRLARLFACFAVPVVAFYALLPIAASREPLSSWGDIRSFDSFVDVVTRKDYGGLLSPHIGKQDYDAAAQAGAWSDGVLLAFGGWLLLVALLGAIALFRRTALDEEDEPQDEHPARPVAVALVLAVVVSGPIFAMKNQLEIDSEHGRAFAERFSTMSCVPIGILVGVGLDAIRRFAGDHLPQGLLRVALGLAFVLPLARHADACDLRTVRRGEQLAHDLLREVPDGSLVLVSGDALNGAGLYVCGVERRCGRTLVFSPGQMHLAWRVEQLKRRYPELVVPTPTGKFVTVRELVAANLDRRRVYLTAQLLDLEPALRDAFQYIPDGILVRALRDDVALEAAKKDFLAQAMRLARGEGCEGCAVARSELHAPSLETSIPFMYALAFENHARVLSAWYDDARLAALFALRAEQTDPDAIKKLRAPTPPP